ncbi:MAG: rhomboid family intramembrane serine protease [Ilumatobacteraceae bacterium]
MAGRFSFSVPERRNAGDPWFRIGTLDVGTTILVILLCVASMLLWAVDAATWLNLALLPEEVRSGQVWRVLTWPLANQPGIWEVFTLAIFWYFGREIEGMLGRARFAVLLLLLAIVPGIVGVLLNIPEAGLAPVELGVFLIFIAEYPFARFFFGIPAWAIGAVIVGIQVLQYLGYRETERILLLFVGIATAGLVARSFGLAASVPWIPKIPLPGGGGGGRQRRRRLPKGRGSGGGGRVVNGPWTAPPRGAALPQPPGPAAIDGDQVELDALLDKISERGMEGLSSEEKRRLNDLSKRMRKH